MTCVTFFTDASQALRGFEVDGHSGFEDIGKDIVCAAVSVLTLNTVNSIERLAGDKFKCKEDEKKGYLSFMLEGPASDKAQLLLDSYKLGIEEICNSYGHRFVKMRFKEV